METIQLTGSVVAFVLVLVKLWRVGMLFTKNLWAGREGWSATCLPLQPSDRQFNNPETDASRAFKRSGRWSHCKTMEVGDYFRLTLDKPRMVSRVVLKSDEDRFPHKTKLEVIEDEESIDWIAVGEVENSIDFRFQPARRIYGFRFTIVVPRLTPIGRAGYPPAWAVYDIAVTEPRLWRRWLNRTI